MKSRLLVFSLLTVVLMAACADSDDAESSTPADEEPANEDAAPSGDTGSERTLVVAIDEDPGQLNPAITTSGAVHTASELIFNGLVRLDDQLEPVGELAESWEIEEGGTVYRFHLRDGVVWHDGEPFTSADVKFSFEEVLLDFHSRTKSGLEGILEAIETPDDHTVVFRFSQPYGPLLQQLNVTEAPIVPEHIYAGTDPQEASANLEPVGTGPFRFASYQADAEIVLEANSDYFEEGLPQLDGVVMRVIPEPANQVLALESGEVDWVWNAPGPELERLRSDDSIDLLETPVNPGGANCIMTVTFNLERPMFDDPDTRAGLAHGLDREQFVERVAFGQGRAASAPISSGIPFAHADDLEGMPSFDPEEAERRLEAAGWTREGDGTRRADGVAGVSDGTELAFDFLVFPKFSDYGDLVRAQLAEIGADVTVKTLEPPVFVETVFTERNFDTNIISYCNGPDPAIGVRRMYVSSNIAPIPFSNGAAYSNPEIDRLFDEARAAIERDERSRLYREIQEILVEDLPYFWVVETVSTRAHSATCEGFRGDGQFALAASCR